MKDGLQRLLEAWQGSTGGFGGLILLLVAVLLGVALSNLLVVVSRRVAGIERQGVLAELLRHAGAPLRFGVPLLFLCVALPLADLPPTSDRLIQRLLSVALIAAVAWLLVRFARLLETVVVRRYPTDSRSSVRARAVQTQVRVLRRILEAAIVVVAAASMLMVFDRARQLGTSLLASAGIASVVVGLAAQRTIANVLASLQVALTQPIRVDDVVVIEGEWGRIEEIQVTYVVVRIWDQRRLILPMSYFIEKPLENWTRTSPEILGTVYLHLDYAVPVEALRKELERIAKQAPEWDGRVCNLLVTGASERTLEVRALLSAKDASDIWTLRCYVREKLVAYVQAHHPSCLPQVRAQLSGERTSLAG